ncbi:cytochrome C assembly family protein [Shouchella shacheensis]|uniref:cytochrome C assembly family protein n=1 Tax=Shouchella shacheensis TaxID=1649580 RepID=UPI0007401A50|nr:cytochrome c biogenesis protein [Shouchella shacheensis]
MDWIYPITICLYSLSLLGYFIDFTVNSQKANRTAFWFLSLVWSLQTVYFMLRMIELDRLPMVTPFEGLFFYAWSIVTLSLFINWKVKMAFLVFVMNVTGFIVMTFSLFVPSGDVPNALAELLVSELLILHVIFILLSYTGFTLSFSTSVLYLLEHQMLKQKKWGRRLIRFGSLPALERFSFSAAAVAFPFFLTGLILGIVWAVIEFERFPWADPKILISLVALGAYGFYLYGRLVKYGRGYKAVWLNIIAFLVVLLNFLLSGQYPSFHIWY